MSPPSHPAIGTGRERSGAHGLPGAHGLTGSYGAPELVDELEGLPAYVVGEAWVDDALDPGGLDVPGRLGLEVQEWSISVARIIQSLVVSHSYPAISVAAATDSSFSVPLSTGITNITKMIWDELHP